MVEQRHLRSVQHLVGFGRDAALAVDVERRQHAAQPFERIRRDEAAAVPAIVHDQRLLVQLAIELPHELLQPERLHIRHVDIADLATGQLVHHGAVVRDPRRLAQRQFLRDRLDQNVARGPGRRVGDGQVDRHLGIGKLQQAVGIGRRAQLRAVDRQHIVARLDRQTGLGQRAAIILAGIVAGIDRRQPIAPRRRIQRPIDPQQRGMDLRPGIAIVAAADIGVRVADLALDLADQVIEILTRAQLRQQFGVAVVDRRPIGAVHRPREEHVARQPPGIAVHLRPFGARIDQHSHMAEVEHFAAVVVLGRVFLGIEDSEVLAMLDQHPLAIERQRIGIDILGHGLDLARLKIEEAQRRRLAFQRAIDHADRLAQEEHALAACIHRDNVRGIDRQRHRARHHAIEIDVDRRDRRRLVRRGGLVGLGPGLFALRLGGLGGALARIGIGAAVRLVRARGHGGWRGGRQRDRIDARGLHRGEIEFEIGHRRRLVAVGDEVEVLAIGRPDRAIIDLAAIAEPRRAPRGDLVEIEIPPAVGRAHAIGDPAPVGREALVVDLAQLVLRDLLRRRAGGADDPQRMRAIAERQRLAIGREGRAIKIATGEMGQQPFGAPFRRADRDLLVAVGIGGIGDQLAVGRPGGMVFIDARRAGQVARRAVFGRHAEDIAARRKQRPLAVGRQRIVELAGGIAEAQRALDVGDARAGAGIVVGHGHRHFAELLARQIDAVELAALLESDGIAAERREIDVVIGEVGDLARLPGIEIIGPDVGAAMRILVREIIDVPAIPHRRGVGARPIGDLSQRLGVEIIGKDLLGQTAVIPLPGAEVAEDAVIGDAVTVGPIGGKAHRAVDRQRRWRATRDRHLPHLLDPAVPLVALGQVDDRAGIGGPGHHHVVRAVAPAGARLHRRMPGQPPRRAAAGRDHPDVGAGLARLGIGDPAPVGRDARHHVLPRPAGHPHGGAAGPGDGPDVAIRHEHDAIAVRLRIARQGRHRRRRQRGRQEQSQEPGRDHALPLSVLYG